MWKFIYSLTTILPEHTFLTNTVSTYLKLKNNLEGVAVLTNFVMCLFSFQAGLNMLTVYTARDLKADEILCISIHPGYVKTDMGGDEVNLVTEIKT